MIGTGPARPAQTAPHSAPTPARPREAEVDLSQIMGPQGRLNIRHGDQVYVLRLTRAGKLLLTK